MYTINPIRTHEDYENALALVEPFFDDEPSQGTPEYDYFDVMVTLIEAYESKYFPIEQPTAVEAIKFRMDQLGLGVNDLGDVIGRPNRVYEILNGTRSLSLNMIKRLNQQFNISADVLIR